MRNQQQQKDNGSGGIWYFGYGPLVHPMVRHRRGVQVEEEQAAILPNHRLTFAYGGVASVVEQRGYEIHGIVMKCKSQSDWDKLQKSEGGYYATEVTVYPYSESPAELPVFDASPEEEEYDAQSSTTKPIRAKVFVMTQVDEAKLDKPLERLPQERYLRLIATGMSKYNCDPDYINDQIMGVPFDPSRTPDNYLKFPVLQLPDQQKRHSYSPFSTKHYAYAAASDTDFESASEFSSPGGGGLLYHPQALHLPKITYPDYQKLCAAESSASPQGNDNPKHLYFIVGRHVCLIYNPGKAQHPGFQWFAANAFGKPDVTFYLHQTHVDPDIPFCENRAQINPVIHCPWAENLMSLAMGQGLDIFRVFELVGEPNNNHNTAAAMGVEEESKANVERLKAFLKPNSGSGDKPRRSAINRITSKIKKELSRGRRSSAAT